MTYQFCYYFIYLLLHKRYKYTVLVINRIIWRNIIQILWNHQHVIQISPRHLDWLLLCFCQRYLVIFSQYQHSPNCPLPLPIDPDDLHTDIVCIICFIMQALETPSKSLNSSQTTFVTCCSQRGIWIIWNSLSPLNALHHTLRI